MSIVADFRPRLRRIAHELAKFGSVGAIAFVITLGLGNILRGGFDLGPMTSNALATIVATTFAYFANRHWTFRHRDRSGLGREYALFFGLNGVGLVITELFVGFTHYVLHLDALIWFNVATVIGTGFATIFRFWAYRKWVFLAPEPAEAPAPVRGSYAPAPAAFTAQQSVKR
ncbi:GtrA family protein [Actinocorallia longicatena]|uniref:GtrA family protein n=1 Tax=Actinocorallia longicatena TaxID=111803 RepID=A0ABP6QJD8_9ACTN